MGVLGTGVGGEERMAPGGAEREVKVGDGAKAGRETTEVSDVATEGEGGTGRAIRHRPFPADKRHGVAGSGVRHSGEDDGEDRVR